MVILAIPVIAVRPSLLNLGLIGVLAAAYFGIGFLTDRATQLHADADGVYYLPGGRDRAYLAWSEIGTIVPRSFSGWPAENALVVLDHERRPLMVASVSMFDRGQIDEFLTYAQARVPVGEPVRLSPFTAKADGVAHPELVPERTSERFLASAVGGLLLSLFIAAVLFILVEL